MALENSNLVDFYGRLGSSHSYDVSDSVTLSKRRTSGRYLEINLPDALIGNSEARIGFGVSMRREPGSSFSDDDTVLKTLALASQSLPPMRDSFLGRCRNMNLSLSSDDFCLTTLCGSEIDFSYSVNLSCTNLEEVKRLVEGLSTFLDR